MLWIHLEQYYSDSDRKSVEFTYSFSWFTISCWKHSLNSLFYWLWSLPQFSHVSYVFASLGTLFKRLANMISEQAELVERIDDDVEQAVSHSDRAHSLLLKTYEKVSSNKALYMKVFAILALFILFFVLFLM